jgi:Ni/Co efflux regulator RcnB
MMKRTLIITAFAGALSLSAIAPAASQEEQVYGSQLMTKQERAEHRKKMRSAKTVEAREQVRAEHHERMKERAKARGVTLPDQPPAVGGGMGPGGGAGAGMGGGR